MAENEEYAPVGLKRDQAPDGDDASHSELNPASPTTPEGDESGLCEVLLDALYLPCSMSVLLGGPVLTLRGAGRTP